MLTFIYLFILAYVIAVIGFVYTEILVQKPILNWWYQFLAAKIGKYPFLFNPIVDCYVCVTGQMALWFYLIGLVWLQGNDYEFISHIYLISQAILNVIIIKSIYTKTLA